MKIFAAVWLSVILAGALTAACVATILMAGGETAEGWASLGLAGFLTGMLAFGGLVIAIGNGYGRADEAYLRGWVARTMQSA